MKGYNMEKGLVSIVIATYNSARTLQTALASVANQTYANIELVVVDGGSTDGTLEMIETYAFKRKTYISEKDKGIFDALNKGVKMSSGEWIFVLGSDDELLPDGSDTLIQHSDGFDVVYGNTINRFDDGSLTLFKAKDYHCLNHIICCCHQGLIMKKDCILRENGFNLNYPLRADFDLIQRCYLKEYRFRQVDASIAYYYVGGASGQANLSSDIERYHILKNNHSTKFPFLVFLYYFMKKLVRLYIYDPKKI